MVTTVASGETPLAVATPIVELAGAELFTTSLVVANGTGNEHKNVLELIRRHIEKFQRFGLIAFETRKSGGRPTQIALLNEHHATLLITFMRNSDVVTEFKVALVDAFYRMASALKRQQYLGVPQNLSDALRFAADLADRNKTLSTTIEAARPKVLGFERLTDSRGSLCITDAGKALKMRPRAMFKWLADHEWIYRRGDVWRGYQKRVEQGYLLHRVVVRHGLGEDCCDRLFEQVLVTPRGLAAIARRFEDHAAERAIAECSAVLSSEAP